MVIESQKESDPRVFFAAERTLLAWLRTGLTIIAIGFMISRFGLFIKLLAIQSNHPSPSSHMPLAPILGIAFVLIGSVAIASAAFQQMRFVNSLTLAQLPKGYASQSAVILSLLIALLGLGLAVFLWFGDA